MNASGPESPAARVRAFWRRTLTGPPAGARIEIYEELAPSLGAGIGVREALRTVAGRHAGAKRRTVEILADGLARDAALSDSMRGRPDSFSAIEAALVATGERTGRLDAAFRAAAAHLDRTRATRNRVVAACAYPAVLVHGLILIPTLGMIAVSRGFGAWLAFVVPALALLWGTFFAAVSAYVAFSGRRGFSAFIGRVPLVGRVVRAAALARFARSLAALHGAGVAHEEALRVAAEASGHALLVADAALAAEALRRGEPFAAALARMDSIPGEDRGILLAGDESGELEESARRVAGLEDERFEVVTRRAMAVLPSILVAVVGLAVAVLAFSVIGGYYSTLTGLMR